MQTTAISLVLDAGPQFNVHDVCVMIAFACICIFNRCEDQEGQDLHQVQAQDV